MKEKRLESLDALRGFDMLMIMGLGNLVIALCSWLGWGTDCALARQFEHVEWNGLRFEDTIFPLFLFLAGVSWPFSYARQLERGKSNGQILRKGFRRMLLLVLFGLMYGGLLSGQLRMGSVLGRIGVAWFVSAAFYLCCSRKLLVLLAFAFPIGYWLLLYFVPAPDVATLAVPEKLSFVWQYGTGPFSIVGNLSGWLDRTIMPGVLIPYTGIADNQSVLGVVPAIGTALLGVLSGEFLRVGGKGWTENRKVVAMLALAVGLVALGLVIAFGFGEMSMPINKKLWSASFTFVVGGYSVAMLAVFHWLVDLKGFRRWTFFFKVIGMNSITIYLWQKFVPMESVTKEFFGGVASLVSPTAGEMVLAVGYIALCWLFLYFLYRKHIFLKV